MKVFYQLTMPTFFCSFLSFAFSIVVLLLLLLLRIRLGQCGLQAPKEALTFFRLRFGIGVFTIVWDSVSEIGELLHIIG
jgi:hypothetical protein